MTTSGGNRWPPSRCRRSSVRACHASRYPSDEAPVTRRLATIPAPHSVTRRRPRPRTRRTARSLPWFEDVALESLIARRTRARPAARARRQYSPPRRIEEALEAPLPAGRRRPKMRPSMAAAEREPMNETSRNASEVTLHSQEHRSPHFLLRFPAESLAERDAPRIAARLETLYEALKGTLELPDLAAEPICVSLGATIDPAGGPAPPRSADAVVEDGRIRATYRSDAPGKGLDRALAELALTSATGRLDGTSVLVDGVLGHVSRAVEKPAVPADDAARELSRRDGQPSIAEVLRRPATEPPPPTWYPVLTSFVGFLLATHGAARFKTFARELDAAAPDRAAEGAYGLPLVVLEQAWVRWLRTTRPPTIPGIAAFLRRSAVYLRPYWKQECLILAGTLLTVGFSIVQPLAFQWIIDRAINPRDFRFLGLII